MSGTKYETVKLRVNKTMDDIADALEPLRASLKGQVTKNEDALDSGGFPEEYISSTSNDKVAINFYGTKAGAFSFKKNWVVLLCIASFGDYCDVFLTAVGSGALARVWFGKSQTIDLELSLEKRDAVANVLRRI